MLFTSWVDCKLGPPCTLEHTAAVAHLFVVVRRCCTSTWSWCTVSRMTRVIWMDKNITLPFTIEKKKKNETFKIWDHARTRCRALEHIEAVENLVVVVRRYCPHDDRHWPNVAEADVRSTDANAVWAYKKCRAHAKNTTATEIESTTDKITTSDWLTIYRLCST